MNQHFNVQSKVLGSNRRTSTSPRSRASGFPQPVLLQLALILDGLAINSDGTIRHPHFLNMEASRHCQWECTQDMVKRLSKKLKLKTQANSNADKLLFFRCAMHVTLTTDVACWAWFVLHSRQIGVKQNKRKMKQTWKLTNCLTKNPNLRWWWWWWWQCRFRRSHREIPPLHLPNMGFFLNMFWYWHKTCTCCFGFLSTLIYVGVYWY